MNPAHGPDGHAAAQGPEPAIGPEPAGRAPRVVCLGGGHGLAASLAAARRLTTELTAVVTVADDGGSSGRLRRELGAVPPGDLRMALAALAGDDDWGRLWAGVLQHRFGGNGTVAGHPVGNLLLAGISEHLHGDTVRALRVLARMVGAVGTVLPMSEVPLEITAEVAGTGAGPTPSRRVRGQVAVATTPGRVLSVDLAPTDPPACAAAVAAVDRADFVVLGPGSWFTSVLPHLLVPELCRALYRTAARRVVVLNLAPQPGETDGFSPEQHLRVLVEHAPGLRIDAIVADVDTVVDTRGLISAAGLRSAAAMFGASLVLEPVAAGDGTPRHDPARLAAAFARVFNGDAEHGEGTSWR